ncbi:MAG: cell division protein FtsZ [Mangrovibacterium sp.]
MDIMINEDKMEQHIKSIIKVIGVGGAGCNAVNHMYVEGIHDVEFLICNTDAQALAASPIETKIQLGAKLTEGRGAGNMPEQGKQAAIENIEDVRKELIDNTKMVFVTAGMGGGTGTGAAPVIAELAKSMGILTIAVVSIPSPREGRRRYEQAMNGIDQMRNYVDSMVVISNEKLHKNYGEMTASKAFKQADNVITAAVKGVAEIITVPGTINIDFADVFTVLENSKVFIMGTGFAEGKGRAMNAVHQALESPLLDSNDINGAEDILLNIISGNEEVTIDEVGEILDFLQDRAGDEANIIWGNGIDTKLGNKISVTVVATRFAINPSDVIQAKEVKRLTLKEEENSKPNVYSNDIQPTERRVREVFQTDEFQPPKVVPVKQMEVLEQETPEFTTRKPQKMPILTEKQENVSTDNWFKKMFNSLLNDGEDAPLKD